ncbi:Osmotin thaumatin-like protein [Lactarius quietus]|nr:Osmotin thaumatin-like protein [Lactarius quietus]
MKIYIPLLLSASSFLTTAMGRVITVTNNCPYTIWPAVGICFGMVYFQELTTIQLYTASDTAPDHPTGWVAPPSSFVSITVPGNWGIGHIWGRRDCNFNTANPGPDSCLDGGCPGGLLCTGQGQSPVTVAEFTLSSDPNVPDYYDISLIDGFNIPMRIDNNGDCGVPQCSVDLGANCPTPLQEPYKPAGFSTGCNSACKAGLAADPNNDPNCCTGKYASAATCPTSSVQYYSYFKNNCQDTYVYLFDGSNGSPLFSCPSTNEADYGVTFCP